MTGPQCATGAPPAHPPCVGGTGARRCVARYERRRRYTCMFMISE